jgi:transposase
VAYNFIPCDRDQSFLMPPSISDWLPEDHLAWFILDACSQMDLSAFRAKYRADGWGAKAFSPDMMVSLLLYAYCMGERSSRKIERACETDVAFRVMAANAKPDHSTIARFRRKNLKQLEKLFTQILRLCAEAGLVKVGVVAIDGTKMEANAALAANKKHEGLEKEIEREVAKMLAEAESVDRDEDGRLGKKRGDPKSRALRGELPEDMRVQKTRIERLRECRQRLEEDAQDRAAEQQRRIDERAAKEAATGVKLRGRKLKEPDPTPSKEARANPTDPESRILKNRKGYVQGFNAQAAVTEEQIIVAAEVTQEENDVGQLHSTIAKTAENLARAGVEEEVGTALADAGYWSEANAEAHDDGPDLLIATTKDWQQRKVARERPPPRGRIPNDISCRARMERKLMTKRGRATYKKRSQTVEPVFPKGRALRGGQIKDARGCKRFNLRGLDGASGEWKLICGTHNLLKLWRSGRASRN